MFFISLDRKLASTPNDENIVESYTPSPALAYDSNPISICKFINKCYHMSARSTIKQDLVYILNRTAAAAAASAANIHNSNNNNGIASASMFGVDHHHPGYSSPASPANVVHGDMESSPHYESSAASSGGGGGGGGRLRARTPMQPSAAARIDHRTFKINILKQIKHINSVVVNANNANSNNSNNSQTHPQPQAQSQPQPQAQRYSQSAYNNKRRNELATNLLTARFNSASILQGSNHHQHHQMNNKPSFTLNNNNNPNSGDNRHHHLASTAPLATPTANTPQLRHRIARPASVAKTYDTVSYLIPGGGAGASSNYATMAAAEQQQQQQQHHTSSSSQQQLPSLVNATWRDEFRSMFSIYSLVTSQSYRAPSYHQADHQLHHQQSAADDAAATLNGLGGGAATASTVHNAPSVIVHNVSNGTSASTSTTTATTAAAAAAAAAEASRRKSQMSLTLNSYLVSSSSQLGAGATGVIGGRANKQRN